MAKMSPYDLFWMFPLAEQREEREMTAGDWG